MNSLFWCSYIATRVHVFAKMAAAIRKLCLLKVGQWRTFRAARVTCKSSTTIDLCNNDCARVACLLWLCNTWTTIPHGTLLVRRLAWQSLTLCPDSPAKSGFWVVKSINVWDLPFMPYAITLHFTTLIIHRASVSSISILHYRGNSFAWLTYNNYRGNTINRLMQAHCMPG